MSPARRSSPLLPAAVLAVGACLLVSLLSEQAETQGFLTAAPAAGPRAQGRVAMRGFKDDFMAWRSTLTAEEKALVLKQANGEFDKNFRKSAEFKKDLPEEKIKSLAKIVSKFFDSEAEDYKKDVSTALVPEYDGLLTKKNKGKPFDFSLKSRIVEVNRDADRRYNFASQMIFEAEERGEKYPQSSPMQEIWGFQNNDTESHEANLKVIEFLKTVLADPATPASVKPLLEESIKKGIPPLGEKFELLLPQVPVHQTLTLAMAINKGIKQMAQEKSPAEVEAFKETEARKLFAGSAKILIDTYVKARDEVEEAAQNTKKVYLSQRELPGKTKADVLKEIWAELPKHAGKALPPLDEEFLAELAKEPANLPGEFRHSWGTADKLWKSEAIDSFGLKYLLGVFETKEEATKAFQAWNAEYEKARKEMKAEMVEWGKQEEARVNADTSARERIKAVLDEARA